MEENKYRHPQSDGASPLALEHARRRRRKGRRRGASRGARYFVAILFIVLVFFLAYSIGSWVINNYSNTDPKDTETPQDTVTTLQSRLDDLTAQNKALSDEVSELQSKLDKYNEKYGPLESTEKANSTESSADTSSEDTAEVA